MRDLQLHTENRGVTDTWRVIAKDSRFPKKFFVELRDHSHNYVNTVVTQFDRREVRRLHDWLGKVLAKN